MTTEQPLPPLGYELQPEDTEPRNGLDLVYFAGRWVLKDEDDHFHKRPVARRINPSSQSDRTMQGCCVDCGRKYGDEYGFPDLVLPDDVWAKISPNGNEGGLLCPSCICRRLHERGIETEGHFMSGPLCERDGRWVFNRDDDPSSQRLTVEHNRLLALIWEMYQTAGIREDGDELQAVKDLRAEVDRLRKQPPSQSWIPMPPAPGGRLPTEKDADERGVVFCMLKDGSVSSCHHDQFLHPQYTSQSTRPDVWHPKCKPPLPDPYPEPVYDPVNNRVNLVAWRPLPAPYVPPPEPVKRRRACICVNPDRPWKGNRVSPGSGMGEAWEVPQITPHETFETVEQLPGDIDPDAARALVENTFWHTIYACLRSKGQFEMSRQLEASVAACQKRNRR